MNGLPRTERELYRDVRGKRRFSNRRAHRRAYVLLLVILLLLMAAVVLVRTANRTLREHSQALQQVSALQAKWARISCQSVALKIAPQVFADLEAQQEARLASGGAKGRKTARGPDELSGQLAVLRQTLSIGEQPVQLLLADESAKVDLNRMAAITGSRSLERSLMVLVGPRYARSVRAALDVQQAFDGWGRVFDLRHLRKVHGHARVLAEATERISIWNPGTLNVRRASDEAIREVCTMVVPKGRANRFIESLHENPLTELAILLEGTIQNKDERIRLAELLSDSSRTYSVWAEANSATGQTGLSLAIRSVDEAGLLTTRSFELD